MPATAAWNKECSLQNSHMKYCFTVLILQNSISVWLYSLTHSCILLIWKNISTSTVHINYYNGRLPVKALAHRSWPPITENILIHIYWQKKSAHKQKTCKNKWHVHKHEQNMMHSQWFDQIQWKIIYSDSYCCKVCNK